MNHFAREIARVLLRLASATSAVALLSACGSGAVSGPPTVPTVPGDPQSIAIQPGTATAFPDLPTTFVITGGNGSYLVSSSNQTVLPLSGPITGNSLTVSPNFVAADTEVTLTVRDTGTATPATATLAVRPRTVSNSVVVTATSTRCQPAICAGDDATVEATLAQGGAPLAGRAVRFDVVSGDFAFITSGAGAPTETVSTSTTVSTDLNGKARVRFRANSNARTQTALMSVTDLSGGSFVRTNFSINGSPTAPTVIPDRVTVRGPRIGQCATGSAEFDIFVFGGVPPYSISNTQPTSLVVSTGLVGTSGGSFRVTTQPNACFTATIIVTDAVGQRSLVTVESLEGTLAQANPDPGNLVVLPGTVTLDSCAVVANATVAGGLGTYQAPVSSSSNVLVTLSGSTLSIRRAPNSPATTSPVSVAISDGRAAATVTVNLVGAGAGACP